MYLIKDLIYANRWADMPDGYKIKFDNQMANVPDIYINAFKTLEFVIVSHTEDPRSVIEPKQEVVVEKVEPVYHSKRIKKQ